MHYVSSKKNPLCFRGLGQKTIKLGSEDAGVPVRLEIVAHGKRGALDLRTIVRPTDHFIQILRTIPGVNTAYYEYSSHAQFVWHEGSLTRPESVLRR